MLLLLACVAGPELGAEVGLQRHTTAGDVIGGNAEHTTDAWLGVPFAAPPVGALRWRAPHAPEAWTTPRPATTYAPACTQPKSMIAPKQGGDVVGQEDCLYLNVWAPEGAADLPVMVWFHGGGNSIGATSTYDGALLAAEQHVVVVTVAYRLGPLGWLRHPALRADASPEEASGNFGTLDQIAGLRWVHENIAAFGGDPGAVTIFGESAGGQDTYAMLVSPLARGLFARAIAQSPVIRSTRPAEAEVWASAGGVPHSSRERLAELATSQGRTDARTWLDTSPDVASWARSVPADELIRAWRGPKASPSGMLDMPMMFADGVVLPAEPWVSAFARSDGWADVPVITGSNQDELKLFLMMDPELTGRRGLVPYARDPDRYDGVARGMSRFWKAAFVDDVAAAMVASGQPEVRVYRFDWAGEPRLAGTDFGRLLGAAHGLEVPFVWGRFAFGKLGNLMFDEAGRPEREKLGRTMRDYWGAFARTGKVDVADAPAWTTDGTLLLDIAPGGVRMDPVRETVPGVLHDAEQDPRLHRDRCEVERRLRKLHFVESADCAYPPQE